MSKLPERLGFDLADPLARDGEVLADLFERVLRAVADAEAHLDDLLLARRQRLQYRLGLLLEVQVDHRVGGRNDGAIFDEVAKMRIFLFADRRLEGDRLLRDLEDLPHLADRDVHPLRDLFRGRLAAQFLDQRTRGANQLVDRFDHVNRDADGPRLVRNRAGDRLPDPPRRVGRKLVAAPVLELVHRLHQSDVAFLNQIEKLQPAVRVLLRDRDDETKVGLDQLLLRLLGLPFAFRDRVERATQLLGRFLELVGLRLQRRLQILDALLEQLLVFLAQLQRLTALRRHQLSLDVRDLALRALDDFNLLLDLLDHAPLHELG